MTLDREDIRAIAEELARILGPKLGVRPENPQEEEPYPLPGSFAARRREALERHAAGQERRNKRKGTAQRPATT